MAVTDTKWRVTGVDAGRGHDEFFDDWMTARDYAEGLVVHVEYVGIYAPVDDIGIRCLVADEVSLRGRSGQFTPFG